ncbi:MAG: NifB/NifX family molybdenum-iron cluster-binding protein [Elusimicrobiales bacterium]|nr:NifB/NifX family molybdenum-iron cluster-binding protein [Elusimicrobiales bacterium]
MRLCIPVEKNEGMESKVYGHFGSAPVFAVYDTEKAVAEFNDNANMHHEHGKCNPVGSVQELKADAIAVGGIGLRALMMLNQGGIKVFRAPAGGSLEDAIAMFKDGKLEEMTGESCCSGHDCHH